MNANARKVVRSILPAVAICIVCVSSVAAQTGTSSLRQFELNDSHFHLTNYVQHGTDIRDFLRFMGNKVGRVALFGIPLQQTWSYRVDRDRRPNYYLQSDAPLYYYSFTDAWIAMAYKSLAPDEQVRFDPMITGFNPADMYAADHIERVLQTFPGVFTGIGEFSIHKEFVSAKIPGEVASLSDPALDGILDFCAESGLLVLIHNDLDTPFPKAGDQPAYLAQMRDLIRRHPATTVIWAHTGMGRIVRPVQHHAAVIEEMLKDPAFSNLYFDISWTEVAKYLLASPEATKIAADLFNRYPNRFLFGTDEVAPTSQEQYLKIYSMYGPLWKLLTPEASEKIRKGNYERLFDAARRKVRAWEKAHVGGGAANEPSHERRDARGDRQQLPGSSRSYLAALGKAGPGLEALCTSKNLSRSVKHSLPRSTSAAQIQFSGDCHEGMVDRSQVDAGHLAPSVRGGERAGKTQR